MPLKCGDAASSPRSKGGAVPGGTGSVGACPLPADGGTGSVGACPLPVEELPVHELLLLVADAEHGRKPEAMTLLLRQGLEKIYPVLEAAVRDDDNADLRNGAMETLVKFGKESVPRLTKLLRDENEEVRNFSAVMLGDIGSRKAIRSLIDALGDPDPNVGHSAAEALGKIGDPAALTPLIALLQGDLWVQFPAVIAMGALRDHRAVPHLVQLLGHELLAIPAAEALAKIGDPRAMGPLAGLLPHEDRGRTEAAARAMVDIREKINDRLNFKNTLADCHTGAAPLRKIICREGVEKLKGLLRHRGAPEAVEAAAVLLGWLGELSSVDDLLALLSDERYLPAVEGAIFSIGAAAGDRLVEALADERERVRIVVLRSLRRFGIPCPLEELARLLASPEPAVQLEALESFQAFPLDELLPEILRLVETGSDESSVKACEALAAFPFVRVRDHFWNLAKSRDPLHRRRGALLLRHLQCDANDGLDYLFQDQDAGVRGEVVKTIGLRQAWDAIPLLRRALSDPEDVVRETAVIASAEFGEPVLLQEILSLLGSGSEALDYAVIRSVGMMGDPAAGAALVEYLGKGEIPRELAYALIETLGKIRYKDASALVRSGYLRHSDPDFRRLAVQTLGNLGDGNSLDGVEEAASDPHWSVRIAALHVLGKIGGAGEVPLLLQAMRDHDPMVRKHAIAALGELRNSSTIPHLVEQLTDSEMSRHAFESLLQFGRSALPWLHRLVRKNYSVELRERVIDLIGKIGDRKSVEPLMELLDDRDLGVRLAAIDALSYCYDSLPLKKLMEVRDGDASAEVRCRAALALSTLAMESYC